MWIWVLVSTALRNPIGHEDVDFVRRLGVAIRYEDQLFAIGRKLRKGAEAARGGDALNVRAVESDGVELELAGAQVLVIRRKNNSLAVDEESRGETGAAELGDLMLLAAIGAHHPKIHFIRLDEIFGEQRFIARNFLVARRMMRAIDDPFIVGRKERPAIVAQCLR